VFFDYIGVFLSFAFLSFLGRGVTPEADVLNLLVACILYKIPLLRGGRLSLTGWGGLAISVLPWGRWPLGRRRSTPSLPFYDKKHTQDSQGIG